MLIYPVYCFCEEKTVVHVPGVGDVYAIDMLEFRAERRTFEYCAVGGNWAMEKGRVAASARNSEAANIICNTLVSGWL